MSVVGNPNSNLILKNDKLAMVRYLFVLIYIEAIQNKGIIYVWLVLYLGINFFNECSEVW